MAIRTLPLCTLLFAAGCSALGRVQDCDAVVEIVNGGLADVRFEAPDAGDDEAYERIASAYEEVSRRLGELSITDSTLEKAVSSYREVVDRAAKNSRAYGHEFGAGGATKNERKAVERRLERIRTQAKTEIGREATAVRKINALCRPH